MSDDDMEEDNEDENIDTVYIFEFFRKKKCKNTYNDNVYF